MGDEVSTSSVEDTDLHCPLCEYNLRGLTEPRCPECGHAFDWNELREATTNRHPWLFENQRRGVRGFLANWRRSLVPGRFWKSIRTSHSPDRRRLILYFVALTILSMMLMIIPAAVLAGRSFIVVRNARQSWPTRVVRWASPAQIAAYQRQYGSLQNAANTLFPYWPSTLQVFVSRFSIRSCMRTTVIGVAEFAFLWPVLTFATLMLYRGVLRLERINNVHVLRVVMYSASPIVLLWLVLAWVAIDDRQQNWRVYNLDDLFGDVQSLCFVIMWAWLAYRVTIACHRYLRLPLLVQGAMLTQVLVGLVILKVLMISTIGWW